MPDSNSVIKNLRNSVWLGVPSAYILLSSLDLLYSRHKSNHYWGFPFANLNAYSLTTDSDFKLSQLDANPSTVALIIVNCILRPLTCNGSSWKSKACFWIWVIQNEYFEVALPVIKGYATKMRMKAENNFYLQIVLLFFV